MSKVQVDLTEVIKNGKGEQIVMGYHPLQEGQEQPEPIFFTVRDVFATAIGNLSREKLIAMPVIERGALGVFNGKICTAKNKVSLPTETIEKIKGYALDFYIDADLTVQISRLFDGWLGTEEAFSDLGFEEVIESLAVVTDETPAPTE